MQEENVSKSSKVFNFFLCSKIAQLTSHGTLCCNQAGEYIQRMQTLIGTRATRSTCQSPFSYSSPKAWQVCMWGEGHGPEELQFLWGVTLGTLITNG
jgi:hypothetical protein